MKNLTHKEQKKLLKKMQEIDNQIENLELRISMLQRERREISNYLDLNKQGEHNAITD